MLIADTKRGTFKAMANASMRLLLLVRQLRRGRWTQDRLITDYFVEAVQPPADP